MGEASRLHGGRHVIAMRLKREWEPQRAVFEPAAEKEAAPSGRPNLSYDDFPLAARANGQRCKRIRNKLHYFGKWDDPQPALKLYLDQRDDLQAGSKPQPIAGELTVKRLCNTFCSAKEIQRDNGELTPVVDPIVWTARGLV